MMWRRGGAVAVVAYDSFTGPAGTDLLDLIFD